MMKKNNNNETPMDIAIEQKSHQKCFLLAKACFSPPNNYTHDGLVSSIPKLINEKYDDVVEYIFQNIMVKTNTNALERFELPRPRFKKSRGCNPKNLFTGTTKSNIVEVQTYKIILEH